VTAVTRREFVSLVPAALISKLGLAPQQASTREQQFRVGHNTTTYLQLERSTDSFWKGVEELSSIGIRGTEVDENLAGLSQAYADRAPEFKERLAKHGMTLVALYKDLPLYDAALVQESIADGMRVGKFLNSVGGQLLNLAGGSRDLNGHPVEHFKTMAGLVNELGKRLRGEHGVRLGIHPHMGHLIQTREDIDRIMGMTDADAFSLCPDTGHLAAAGADVLDVFKTYRSRIIYMHYKDYDPNLITPRTAQTGHKGGFVELGKGVIDFKPVTEFLLTSGYRDWLMIELDSTPTTPLDSAKKNKAFVTDQLHLRVP
jgi:inosose dehydratase